MKTPKYKSGNDIGMETWGKWKLSSIWAWEVHEVHYGMLFTRGQIIKIFSDMRKKRLNVCLAVLVGYMSCVRSPLSIVSVARRSFNRADRQLHTHTHTHTHTLQCCYKYWGVCVCVQLQRWPTERAAAAEGSALVWPSRGKRKQKMRPRKRRKHLKMERKLRWTGQACRRRTERPWPITEPRRTETTQRNRSPWSCRRLRSSPGESEKRDLQCFPTLCCFPSSAEHKRLRKNLIKYHESSQNRLCIIKQDPRNGPHKLCFCTQTCWITIGHVTEPMVLGINDDF